MNRYLLLIVFVFLSFLCSGLNVKSLGAKGDGVQEDSPYLNAAIERALLIGEDLYIPAELIAFICSSWYI